MDLNQLTYKQQKFLHFIMEYKEENWIWPTYREIAAHFGYKSPNSVTQNIQALVKKGFLYKTDETSYEINPTSSKDKRILLAYQIGYYEAKMETVFTKRKAAKALGISHSNFSGKWKKFPKTFSAKYLKDYLTANNKQDYLLMLYSYLNLTKRVEVDQ